MTSEEVSVSASSGVSTLTSAEASVSASTGVSGLFSREVSVWSSLGVSASTSDGTSSLFLPSSSNSFAIFLEFSSFFCKSFTNLSIIPFILASSLSEEELSFSSSSFLSSLTGNCSPALSSDDMASPSLGALFSSVVLSLSSIDVSLSPSTVGWSSVFTSSTSNLISSSSTAGASSSFTSSLWLSATGVSSDFISSTSSLTSSSLFSFPSEVSFDSSTLTDSLVTFSGSLANNSSVVGDRDGSSVAEETCSGSFDSASSFPPTTSYSTPPTWIFFTEERCKLRGFCFFLNVFVCLLFPRRFFFFFIVCFFCRKTFGNFPFESFITI